MKFTQFTKEVLRGRRKIRDLEKQGFREANLDVHAIGSNEEITEVVLGPTSRSVFVKTKPRY